MGLRNKTCLITCGPTWVAIDDMRVLANRSTGTLGQLLALKLAQSGAKVSVLEGPVSSPIQHQKIRVRKFKFFNELADLLDTELKKTYDCIIHAAAVSDFQLARHPRGKISSDAKKITLTFVSTPKLIKKIRRRAPKACLVGFKLESSAQERVLARAARQALHDNRSDLLVANSLSDGYTGSIFDKNGDQIRTGIRSRATLASALVEILDRTL